jgi:dienelactone hydrolase
MPTWDLDQLSRQPASYPAPGFEEPGVEALFYEGLSWRGRGTRVFAWYGRPSAADKKVPAMVLVHGGGGTAFAAWVRHWTARGYAAIAMDTCGCTAGGTHGNRPRHALGGPPGWGGFDQLDEPIEDQWMYHAAASVMLARTLLSSRPEVDAGRVGLTGVSWGAVLTCIVAGVDPRFRLAAHIYGCGFLGETWAERWKETGPERKARWLALWDPSAYLARAACPMLWVVGTDDIAFPIREVQKSYRLPRGPRTLVMPVHLKHGHEEGWAPREIGAFADGILKGGVPLARVTGQGVSKGRAWAAFEAACPVRKAELNFTRDSGPWRERRWETVAADLDAAAGRTSAPEPEGATQYYLNLFDDRGLLVSAEHVERRPSAVGRQPSAMA